MAIHARYEEDANHFNELIKELSYLEPAQIEVIKKAFHLAEKAHTGQKRHSGEDYITHPVAVARILASMHMDYQSIAAALLHDVIEDTFVEKSIINESFGEEIAHLVDGVSKLTQIHFETRIEAQAENFRKMLLAMAKDIRVILIKLADRLHNMRTLVCLPAAKRRRIAKETLDIYAPIANRLGMHKFWVELEDLAFAAMFPRRYAILKQSVKKARGNRKEIMQKISTELKQQLEKQNITVYAVNGREKHIFSIYKKMRIKKIPFNEIMDVYAFRIVVDSIDSCYRVLGAVHQLYKPVPYRFKDYIAIPKANNYQSLHTTLFGPYGFPIEIQIRTRLMHREAENGIAAHWLYKSEDLSPDRAQAKAHDLLQGLFELQESMPTPLEFIENVKIDLFPDAVYVFTPQGEIKELPSGATAVDFAYAVHSDVGNMCIAAKINRRLAPLSTVLANGQTVEIITAPGATPNPAWLNFVVTSKALRNIRHYLKEMRRSESKKLGQELLTKTLNTFEINFEELSYNVVDHVLQKLKFKNLDDLYEAIGLGNQLPITVAKAFLEQIAPAKAEKELISKAPFLIRGSQGMLVHFAECCRPIPGDPIVGVFVAGQGLIIHTQNCRHIAKLSSHFEKCVEVQWEQSMQGEFFVDIFVEVTNARGSLATLASAIAASDANIESINMQSTDSHFNRMLITLTVKNRQHLARIFRRARSLSAVSKIYRAKS